MNQPDHICYLIECVARSHVGDRYLTSILKWGDAIQAQRFGSSYEADNFAQRHLFDGNYKITSLHCHIVALPTKHTLQADKKTG